MVTETQQIKAYQIKKGDYLLSDRTFESGTVLGADDNSGTIEVTLKTKSGVDILFFDFTRDLEVIRERKG